MVSKTRILLRFCFIISALGCISYSCYIHGTNVLAGIGTSLMVIIIGVIGKKIGIADFIDDCFVWLSTFVRLNRTHDLNHGIEDGNIPLETFTPMTDDGSVVLEIGSD